jgi:hypothetical protein
MSRPAVPAAIKQLRLRQINPRIRVSLHNLVRSFDRCSGAERYTGTTIALITDRRNVITAVYISQIVCYRVRSGLRSRLACTYRP